MLSNLWILLNLVRWRGGVLLPRGKIVPILLCDATASIAIAIAIAITATA
jgi:hypothetical protein